MATFSKRPRRSRVKFDGTSLEQFPHRLTMYKISPKDEISLEQFEQYAIDRLKLLREIETLSIRFKKGTEEYREKMKNALREFLPTDFHSTWIQEKERLRLGKGLTVEEEHKQMKVLADRRKDKISHFILRLSFSRTEDLRRWFLNQEMDLFRYRFQEENPEEVRQFMEGNGMQFLPINDDEKQDVDSENISLLTKLSNSAFNTAQDQVNRTSYFKVPFQDVLDLVKTRRCYLHDGMAYVANEDLISIIINMFRSKLSQSLTVMSRKLPYLEEDERLLPILKNLSTTYIGDSYTTKKTNDGEKLTLDQIGELSKTSFPLCMRTLHEGVSTEHHLKHFGRLQYGLFLKATGLSLEEALVFWQTEFCKKMDVDKFDKQYAYNIRHSYGKEGKRSDYTAYSCMKIITTNPPAGGDHHGCPFKHSDPEMFQNRLKSYNVHNDAINEIIDLVKQQHFQIACAKYFEVTHKLPENANVNISHPNTYFDESLKILRNGLSASKFQPVLIKQEEFDSSMNSSMYKTEDESMVEAIDMDDNILLEC